MNRRVAAVGVAALVAMIAACSLGDFSGYSGGNDALDGSTNGDGDVDSSNGGRDATSENENGNESDAGADGGAFCAKNGDAGFFCEDFESTNPLPHFTFTKTAAGTLAVVGGALVADAPANSAQSEVYGNISTNLSGSHARLSFDILPEVLNGTTMNDCQVAKLYFFADDKPSYEVGVGIKGLGGGAALYAYQFAEGVSYDEFGDLPPLSTTAATRLVLEARIDAAGPRLNLSRDGVLVTKDAVLTPPASAGNIEAFIGLPFVPPNHGAWRVRVDNVLMELP